MSFLFGSNKNKTFRPKKSLPEGSHQYELLKHAEATLGSGNLRSAVMLPEVGIFLIASQVINFDAITAVLQFRGFFSTFCELLLLYFTGSDLNLGHYFISSSERNKRTRMK